MCALPYRSLLELISSLPPDDRKVSLSTIGARTKLDIDGVEFLLMKALSLHLIEGSIDELAGEVSVRWVSPRVLTKAQVGGIKGRLDAWLGKVSSTVLTLEQDAIIVV